MKIDSEYTIRKEKDQSYTVSKFHKTQEKSELMVVYKVKPQAGFLYCNCPATKTCRHIKLVVRYIRGDRRLSYKIGSVKTILNRKF